MFVPIIGYQNIGQIPYRFIRSGVVEFLLEKTAGAVGPVAVLLTTQDGTAIGETVVHFKICI